MPKVDPESHEPMSDAPDGPDALRGGMQAGDPALEGATETGGTAAAGGPDDTSSTHLPAEEPSDK